MFFITYLSVLIYQLVSQSCIHHYLSMSVDSARTLSLCVSACGGYLSVKCVFIINYLSVLIVSQVCVYHYLSMSVDSARALSLCVRACDGY